MDAKEGNEMKDMKKYLPTVLSMLMLVSCIAAPIVGAIGGAGSRAADTDVTVNNIEVIPFPPKVGENLTLNISLRNLGMDNATNTTMNVWATNDTLGGPIDLGTFMYGNDNGMANITSFPAYFNITIYWNTSEPGLTVQTGLVYTLTVNATNNPDVNMSNNQKSVLVLFNPPDMKWPHVTDLLVDPAQVIVGNNMTVNATFLNNGSLPALNEPVFFYLDYNWSGSNSDIYNTTVTISDLFDMGGGVFVEFQYNTTGAALGNHTLTCIVPSTGSNMTSGNITVKPVPPPPGKPDLIIESLGVNRTTVLRGLGINLTVTVKNVGNNESVPTLVNVTDMLSSFNFTIDVPALAADQVMALYQIIDTSELVVGNHNLQIWVDKPNLNIEWNETNNTRYVSFQVTSKPDLALFNMKFHLGASWSNITQSYQGEVVRISVNIKNLGLNSSKNGTKLSFFLDNQSNLIGNKTMYPFSPSANIDMTFDWNTTGVALGQHKILAIVDADNKNDELNESNNEVAANFTIIEVVKPSDLTMESMSMSSTTVSAGDRVTISLVVVNAGAGIAENIDLDATLESTTGAVLATINHTVMPYMGPGSKQYVNLQWYFFENIAPGNYMVKVVLDKSNKIKESNENNNENKTNIKIVDRFIEKTDPMITSIVTDPLKPTEGKKVKVTVTIMNKGNRDSRDLVLTLFLDGKKVGDATITVLGKNNATKSLDFNVTFSDGGSHRFTATLFEGGIQKHNQAKDVEVKDKKESTTFTDTNTVLLILAVLLLVAIAVVLLAGGKKRPSEYEEEDEEEEKEKAVKGGSEEE